MTETNKERRQRTPAVVALVSEGVSSESDPAGIGAKKSGPPELIKTPAGLGLDG